MTSTSFRIRSAGKVMSSRLPIGVPTMYRQPPPGAAPFEGANSAAERGVCAGGSCVRRFLDMPSSLARGAKAIVARMVYSAIPHQNKESFCASVRVQMPEMWPQDGKNRKCERPAFEEVPALRRQSGGAVLRARDPVQRLRLVRNRLRREKVQWRFRKRRQACGRIERVKQRLCLQGLCLQRFSRERFWIKREEDRKFGKIGKIGEVGQEEIISGDF